MFAFSRLYPHANFTLTDIVVYGRYDLILEDHPQIYAYTRTLGREQWLVMLNFSRREARFELPGHLRHSGRRLMIANYADADEREPIDRLELRPYEARVYRLLR